MASVSHRGGKPNFQEAEVIRNQSAFFRAECKRLISETSKRCRDMQNDQTQKLGRRSWSLTGGAAAGVGGHDFVCSASQIDGSKRSSS